jgi:hypothetical protein
MAEPRKSLDEIAADLGRNPPGSQAHGAMLAELNLRQTIAQIEATEAQKRAAQAEERAANAAVETAVSTRANAKYMFWSVIAAVVSAIITAFSVAFNVFSHHP